jgi:UPF0755 protein
VNEQNRSENNLPASEQSSCKEVKSPPAFQSAPLPENVPDGATAVMPDTGSFKNPEGDGAATRISDPISIVKEEQNASAREPSAPTPKVLKKRSRPNSALYSFVFTTVYLTVVLLVSVGISFFALDVANEVFALKKSGTPMDIVLTGDFITVDDLAEQLADQHVIKYPTIFKIYAQLRHKDGADFVAGRYKDIPPEATGYDVLLSLFLPPRKTRGEVTITVPEGYTVDDIIELFVSKGLGTKEAFTEVINTYDFDRERYWFLEDVPLLTDPENDPRIYRLEGFLYPDTYRFYDTYYDEEGATPGTAAAKAVIVKLLEQFRNNFKKSYLTKHRAYMAEKYPDAPELSVYQLLTLASILEKEGRAEERERISAVFYNRLTHPASYPFLNSDATIHYATEYYSKGELLTDAQINASPYNTYTQTGLPAGPIANPGLSSLDAALDPEETGYYYFIYDKDAGVHRFSKTLAEHTEWARKLGLA